MRTLISISIVGLLSLLASCKQGEGEVCQNNRDCDDGLICKAEVEERGFCRDPDDVDETSPPADPDERPLDPDPDASLDAGLDASVDGGSDAGPDADDDAG
jgi:hypothetical protein